MMTTNSLYIRPTLFRIMPPIEVLTPKIVSGISKAKSLVDLINFLKENIPRADILEPISHLPPTLKETSEEIKQLQDRLNINPGDIQVLERYGRLLFYPVLDHPKAVQTYAAVLRLDPRNHRAYYYLGKLMLDENLFQEITLHPQAKFLFGGGLLLDDTPKDFHPKFHRGLTNILNEIGDDGTKQDHQILDYPHTTQDCPYVASHRKDLPTLHN